MLRRPVNLVLCGACGAIVAIAVAWGCALASEADRFVDVTAGAAAERGWARPYLHDQRSGWTRRPRLLRGEP